MDLARTMERVMAELAASITDLRQELVRLRKERDDLKRELERQYHAWTRDDLEDWASTHGVTITDELWATWCVSWADVYSVLAEREVMEAAMEDWWATVQTRPAQLEPSD